MLALSSAGFLQAQTPVATPAPAAPAAATAADEVVTLEEFQVKGIRESMIKAIDVKRNNLQMTEAIVSEDIGKFPDNNVVEALQRLPGVQVTDRGSGQVSTVAIRGLTDVTTTINGRNIFTASGQSVSLPDIPSTLINQIDVMKSRSADRLETGIAGLIDIHTPRPFDFAGRKISLSARGIYQEQADKFDPNLSLLVSNRWKVGSEGKFGALVNVSYALTNYRNQSATAGAMVPFITGTAPAAGAGAWGPYERIFATKGGVSQNPIWQPGLEAGLPTAPGSTLMMNNVAVPYILARDAVFSVDGVGETKRPAANLSLQFAPNKASKYTFEAFYNGYRNENYNSLLFSFADWWGGPFGPVTLYPGTNIVKSRDLVTDVWTFTSGDMSTGKTDSYLYAFTGEWDIGTDFKLKADLSLQNSKFKDTFFAMRGNRDALRRDLWVDFNHNDGTVGFKFIDNPATTINEASTIDPSQWYVAELYDNEGWRKGKAATLNVDGIYTPGWNIIKNVKVGVRLDDRYASEGARTRDGFLGGQTLAQLNNRFPGIVSTNSDFFDGRADVPASWVAIDGNYINSHKDAVRQLYGYNTNQLVVRQNFWVNEKTTAAYAQSEFGTKVGNQKLDGQFGVRFVSVKTDMNSYDYNIDPGQTRKFSGGATTSKALPSFSVRYGLTDKINLRFAYGQTLRRPNFVDLNPNITYVKDVTNIGYGTASGGNKDLKPAESTNYDLSVEYYFQEGSVVYASAFKRKIDGFVVNYRKRVRYDNYDYVLSQPDNASNGKLDGYEFGVVYFPKELPNLLKGFGVQASYTMLDSSQDNPVTNDAGQVVSIKTSPMAGVSDSSYSLVLAYERGRVSGRLSYQWREAFFHNNEAALFANPLPIYFRAEKGMDLQLGFKVMKDLTVTFDATNLTNEIGHSYYGNTGNASTTNNFGSWLLSRTFAVGARYSF